MKSYQKQIEIPEIVLKRWWWRRLVFVKFDEESHTTQHKIYPPEYTSYAFSMEWNMWHRKDELTAFRYELLRRTSFPDLPEWIFLPAWLDSWISGVLAPKPGRSVCAMFAPTAPPGYVSLDWMWDLTASDESLCKFFILMINDERRKKNLPTSDIISRVVGNQQKYKEKRRGERNRQVSWLAVEAFDLKSYKVRPLGDGERSRLSKACREIKTFENPLKQAIEMAKARIPENHQILPQEPLLARFIRENFVQRFASQLQKQ